MCHAFQLFHLVSSLVLKALDCTHELRSACSGFYLSSDTPFFCFTMSFVFLSLLPHASGCILILIGWHVAKPRIGNAVSRATYVVCCLVP